MHPHSEGGAICVPVPIPHFPLIHDMWIKSNLSGQKVVAHRLHTTCTYVGTGPCDLAVALAVAGRQEVRDSVPNTNSCSIAYLAIYGPYMGQWIVLGVLYMKRCHEGHMYDNNLSCKAMVHDAYVNNVGKAWICLGHSDYFFIQE